MTVYSGTFAPVGADGTRFSFRDPIAEAREKLRDAARLPFQATRPNAWQTAFRQLVTDARADIRRHIWLAELPDSPLKAVEDAEPRLRGQVDHQREEHVQFATRIDHLVDEAGTPDDADIWKMIELGEEAILLEMALARHHNRLVQLLYETTHQDVGVAG